MWEIGVTSQSAHGWQIGWHWLAGNSYFPCGWIFISSFSEPIGINIEGLNSLLLGIQLFIYFDWGMRCSVDIGSTGSTEPVNLNRRVLETVNFLLYSIRIRHVDTLLAYASRPFSKFFEQVLVC